MFDDQVTETYRSLGVEKSSFDFSCGVVRPLSSELSRDGGLTLLIWKCYCAFSYF